MNEEEVKQDTAEEEKTEAGQPEETEATENAEPIAGDADEEKGDKDKKKRKDKEKDKKIDELKSKIDELEDYNKRHLAEFENYRRRTEKEKASMFDMGARNVIEKILPVVDNFERGLKTVPQDEGNKAIYDGMNMIYKQLITELDKMGVKPIEAAGKPFDPCFHNAVMQVEKEGAESGTVAEELQKGYTYNDVVIRHAMVSVVQ